MLGLVGFLATALYWPGISGAATTPRWGAIMLIVPWLLRDIRMTAAHWWGIAFLTIAAVSFGWTADHLEAINQAFMLCAWVALFWLGTQTENLRPLYIGCAAGLAVSSAFTLVQAAGWYPLPVLALDAPPAGLFINGNYLAEAAALVAIALVSQRMWWWLAAVSPALILPQARGAFLAFGVALIAWVWGRSKLAVLALVPTILGAILIGSISHNSGVGERLMIWQSTWNGLTLFGHGLGSFWLLYPDYDLRQIVVASPEYAHNEFLTIAFELGIPGVIAALAFCLMLAGPMNTARLVLIALFVEMCFAFPLHLPSTAAIGFIVAGHAVRDRYVLRDLAQRWRMAIGARLEFKTVLSAVHGLPDGGGYGVPLRSAISLLYRAAKRARTAEARTWEKST